MADAVAFVDAIMAAPGVQLASLGCEWPSLRQLCVDKKLACNDVRDGWLADTVELHAEHLFSWDRDFKKLLPRARFRHLKT